MDFYQLIGQRRHEARLNFAKSERAFRDADTRLVIDRAALVLLEELCDQLPGKITEKGAVTDQIGD